VALVCKELTLSIPAGCQSSSVQQGVRRPFKLEGSHVDAFQRRLDPRIIRSLLKHSGVSFSLYIFGFVT
jgi:hypothetical protein